MSSGQKHIGNLKAILSVYQGLNGREDWLVGIKGDPKVVTWISSSRRFEPRLGQNLIFKFYIATAEQMEL